MRWSSRCLGVASVLVIAAGMSLWYRARVDAPGSAAGRAGDSDVSSVAGRAPAPGSAEELAILLEVAKKRFKDVAPTGALARMLPEDEEQAQALMDTLSVEMLKERLVVEKIQQDPFFKDGIEQRMRRREPKLMRLSQTLADGYEADQWVVVFDTTGCSLQDGSTHVVFARELEARFCMDPLLEYPGGFEASEPISLTVYPFDHLATRPEAEEQWTKGLLLEARSAVATELVKLYRKDGRLTF